MPAQARFPASAVLPETAVLLPIHDNPGPGVSGNIMRPLAGVVPQQTNNYRPGVLRQADPARHSSSGKASEKEATPPVIQSGIRQNPADFFLCYPSFRSGQTAISALIGIPCASNISSCSVRIFPEKIAVRQIPAFPANRKAAIEKILAGMAEQHIIIRFKPDLPRPDAKGFVFFQLAGMGQPLFKMS